MINLDLFTIAQQVLQVIGVLISGYLLLNGIIKVHEELAEVKNKMLKTRIERYELKRDMIKARDEYLEVKNYIKEVAKEELHNSIFIEEEETDAK